MCFVREEVLCVGDVCTLAVMTHDHQVPTVSTMGSVGLFYSHKSLHGLHTAQK